MRRTLRRDHFDARRKTELAEKLFAIPHVRPNARTSATPRRAMTDEMAPASRLASLPSIKMFSDQSTNCASVIS